MARPSHSDQILTQLDTSRLVAMRNKVLYAVLALVLAAELQLTSCQEGVTSQHDNSSLPVSYSATVLEGGRQVCPSLGS